MTEPAPHRPYQGPAFFTIKDRKFLFGRENDTRRIVETAQTSRLSMVHAQSGAGKTSALRASVLPTLDVHGYDACYMRPGPDPTHTLRCAVLLRAVSPPAREANALKTAMACYHSYKQETEPHTSWSDVEDMSLDSFCEGYRSIPTHHPAHREMIVESADDVPSLLETAYTHSVAGVSMAGRLLISHRGVEIYRSYLIRLCRLFGLAIFGLDDPKELKAMGVGQIREFLADLEKRHSYQESITRLLTKGDTLAEFFVGVSEVFDCDDTIPPLRHAIFIDQFEEFYTRIRDTSLLVQEGDQRADIKFGERDKFFSQIAELMNVSFWGRREEVRVIISLRDDYVARLGRFELFCGEIGLAQRNSLPLLSPLDTERVVRGPAKAFHIRYDDDVLDAIVNALKTEGRYVLPIKVQIVCDRIWRDYVEETGADVISTEALEKYNRSSRSTESAIRQIIEGYVGERLDRLPLIERMDAIRILASMTTLDGTREVVPYNRLVEKTFVNQTIREKVIELLKDGAIVSVESHSGGRSVEIKHEFLLRSIHKNLSRYRASNPDWQQLQTAIENLEQDRPIGSQELKVLCDHSNVLEPRILRKGLAQKLFRLSAKEPSNLEPAVRKSWLDCWSTWFDAAEPTNIGEVLAKMSGPNPTVEDVRNLRAISDFSAVNTFDQAGIKRLITNIVHRVPSFDAIPILKEIRGHVGRFGQN